MINIVSPQLSGQEKEKLVNDFKNRYDNSDYENTNLMNGVMELLVDLKEMKVNIYLCTNKRLVPTRRLLKKLGIEKFFDRVFTIDFNNGKLMSKSEVLRYMMCELKLEKEETIYVGDTASDIIAASENELTPIIFLDGYGKKEEIFKLKPRYTIRKMSDLTTMINNSYMEGEEPDD
jgi:phosphoglycolate phosphatase